jgi:tRNA (guanosine-2'-O-)-methyltransferase
MPYPYINAQGEIEADETWWATMQSTGRSKK